MSKAIETVKAERLEAVHAILSRRPDEAALTHFAALMFERGSAEDIAAYPAAELAEIAESAWSHLLERTPGRPSVRVYDPEPAGADTSRLAAETVVEVVNDDMPFLLASVMGELTDLGLGIRLVLHPIFGVVRDAAGRLDRIEAPKPGDRTSPRESFIRIHVDRLPSAAAREKLGTSLAQSLRQVRLAVDDWKLMLRRLKNAAKGLRNRPAGAVAEAVEAIDFLDWLADDNFLFLGMRDYSYSEQDGRGRVERIEDSGLGMLADPEVRVLRRGDDDVNASPMMHLFLQSPDSIVVTKANLRSRVHRRAHLDYIGVKQFDEEGRLSGELRILGLFTATAYTSSARTIPFVRLKIDRLLAKAGFEPASHSGKTLVSVLETYPRDELFQIGEDQLFTFAMRILALEEHPRIRALVRRDLFDRFLSALIYLPRDRYTTDVRIRIGEALEKAYDGRIVSWRPTFLESSLMRVHFIVGRYGGVTPEVDTEALERTIAGIVRTWRDALDETVAATFGPARAATVLGRYGEAFSAAYREARAADRAVIDIRIIEQLSPAAPVAIDFYRRGDETMPARVQLALFHVETPVPLSERVPVLENMGLRVVAERTYEIAPAGAPKVYLHDMTLERFDGEALDLDPTTDARLEALFLAVWHDRAENDGFNALSLTAALDWRTVSILRAIGRYQRQIRIPYSLDYVWAALRRYPAIAAALIRLFEARFDPDFGDLDRELEEARIAGEIEAALDQVPSLDDDTILRRYLNVVRSIVRTNVYQLDGAGRLRETLAFKIDSRKIVGMPDPKPFREIFVYSPRVEGVHLRFGKVARGGLRWSDRPQDFRTEVLGLVKAQQVKNAVIVPVGAKGGFVPHRLVAGMSREAWMEEGTAAYKIFVSTLLTVTDNIVGDHLVPPPRVVRHEGDDPYLVVAADKGTATFSDTANGIAEEAGFWLGDAFASGGSVGYDHKKMGITARGAFEAVKRHFREMDVDIMTTPFTVVGVGDMSGDVFGNGMLLAPTIRLLAAFDHRHIFIDPNPNEAASLAERQRLFALPRSSWADYDATLISAGGGVYARSEKAIELSEPARALLGLPAARATPQEVMSAILKAPVDLLWFGGIGTYVRASTETDADAGDRANDAIRIAARDVGAKVVGEGANLGLTQRARIELGLKGVACNSDAIDNSAGVNSSDVEVNIKIALGQAVRAGTLPLAERNTLLASMTDEVGHLVLANNYRQTLAISLAAERGLEDFGYQRRLMEGLERAGRLDRAVEFLPDDAGLTAREKAGRPLTRAEIGVLLAYAKLSLKEDLIGSAVPDDPFFRAELAAYFPSAMRGRFAGAIDAHRLRREIVATRLANLVIDRGGPAFVARIADRTGAAPATIAAAAAAAAAAFGTVGLDTAVDALDAEVPGAVQLELYRAIQDLMIDATVWFLRNVALEGGSAGGLETVIGRFGGPLGEIAPALGDIVGAAFRRDADRRAAEWTEAGVPEDLARRIARLPALTGIPDAVVVAETAGAPLAAAAAVHFGVAERFRIGELEAHARRVAVRDYYDGLALDRARGLLARAHRAIDIAALKADGGLDAFVAALGRAHEAALEQIDEILRPESLTVSRFSVAAALVSDLAAG